MVAKKRLDLLLVEKELVAHRNRARAEIMSGNVRVDGKVCTKPGTNVSPSSEIEILQGKNPYVSRGGLKLAGAAKDLGFYFQHKVVLDVGASTGGFTDYALHEGALKVYAIDVGYGQLDWKLRQSSRVVTMERTNIRYLKPEHLAEVPHIATVDVSFISLQKVLPVLVHVGIPEIVALIKPQFEAGKDKVGKKGVVRDPAVHREVINEIERYAAGLDLLLIGTTVSCLKGPQGNTEYFMYWILRKT